MLLIEELSVKKHHDVIVACTYIQKKMKITDNRARLDNTDVSKAFDGTFEVTAL